MSLNSVKCALFFFLFSLTSSTFAQSVLTNKVYQVAFDSLRNILAIKGDNASFKEAVFITENAYYSNKLFFHNFNEQIKKLKGIVISLATSSSLPAYKYSDSLEVKKCLAIHRLLNDTIEIQLSGNKKYNLLPYVFDFDDFFGVQNWVKMFVTKLLSTNSGNCHSMTYIYKILADEVGVQHAWLSFAPNHIYIKNYCKGNGWYNTEVTSGQFPIDAWVMATGYISYEAVLNGIYMDTLSNQQAVANCVLDLAKGYERKYKIYTDSFIVDCCDLTLKYHPTNINAIIYKAETLKKLYLIYQNQNSPMASAIYPAVEKLYLQAMDLGYKEMPEKMYKEWLSNLTKQKDKFINKKIIQQDQSKQGPAFHPPLKILPRH